MIVDTFLIYYYYRFINDISKYDSDIGRFIDLIPTKYISNVRKLIDGRKCLNIDKSIYVPTLSYLSEMVDKSRSLNNTKFYDVLSNFLMVNGILFHNGEIDLDESSYITGYFLPFVYQLDMEKNPLVFECMELLDPLYQQLIQPHLVFYSSDPIHRNLPINPFISMEYIAALRYGGYIHNPKYYRYLDTIRTLHTPIYDVNQLCCTIL